METLLSAKAALETRFPNLTIALNSEVKDAPFLHIWKPVDLNLRSTCVSFLPAFHVIVTNAEATSDVSNSKSTLKFTLLTFHGKSLLAETIYFHGLQKSSVESLESLANGSLGICKGVGDAIPASGNQRNSSDESYVEHFGDQSVIRSPSCQFVVKTSIGLDQLTYPQCEPCVHFHQIRAHPRQSSQEEACFDEVQIKEEPITVIDTDQTLRLSLDPLLEPESNVNTVTLPLDPSEPDIGLSEHEQKIFDINAEDFSSLEATCDDNYPPVSCDIDVRSKRKSKKSKGKPSRRHETYDTVQPKLEKEDCDTIFEEGHPSEIIHSDPNSSETVVLQKRKRKKSKSNSNGNDVQISNVKKPRKKYTRKNESLERLKMVEYAVIYEAENSNVKVEPDSAGYFNLDKNKKYIFTCLVCCKSRSLYAYVSACAKGHTAALDLKTEIDCPAMCGKKVERGLINDHLLEKHKESNQICCCECLEMFDNDNTDVLNQHFLRKHHSAKPKTHLCTLCGKNMNRLRTLREHIANVHEKKKDFICPTCGLFFATKQRVRIHMKTHEQRGLNCTYCEKTFNNRKSMIKHLLTHSALKPYQCAHCTYVTTKKCYLQSHVKSQHHRPGDKTDIVIDDKILHEMLTHARKEVKQIEENCDLNE